LPASLAFFGKNQKAQPQSVVLLSRSQRQAIAAAAHSVEALVPAVIQVAGADSAQPVIFQAVGVQVAEQSMPSLIGLPWKDVRIALPRAGYAVRLIFGPPAPNAKQVGRVYEQFPSPVICSSRGQRSLSEFTKRQASHGFHESSKSLDEKLIAVAGIIGIRSVEKQSNRMNAVTTSLCNGPSTS
jgi:hypothetical protein